MAGGHDIIRPVRLRQAYKNDQSLVSDADREIPTLGSMQNAGNSVNLVSGIICIPSSWDFFVCIRDR